MAEMRIAENLALLRKEKNVTQEAFAQAMGVTNQAVSKWESGACCPDIVLLPQIAAYYGVSVDALLGQKTLHTLPDLLLRIRALFEETDAGDSFDLAYMLAFALHEGAISRGYRDRLPWQPRERNEDAFAQWIASWGYSACAEPEGTSILQAGAAFFSSAKRLPAATGHDLRRIHATLAPLADEQLLRVLFALYALTCGDYAIRAQLEEIAAKSGLAADVVTQKLDMLPLEAKQLPDGGTGYRLSGGAMALPPVLMLLLPGPL